MQGPDTYLIDMGAALACPVHPDRNAVIDAAHRIFVNWETYYVSDETARATFLQNPLQYTGRLTDPVSRVRFTPTETSPRRNTDDRIYYFESQETARRYDADPGAFSSPMPGMVEMQD